MPSNTTQSTSQTSQNRHRIVQVCVVTAALLVITLSVNLEAPLYKTYAQAAGFGEGLVAVTFAAYVAGLVPVLILLGGISDRLGRKPVMLLSLVTILAANLLILFEPTMPMLINVRLLQGVGVGLSLGASAAYIVEILEDNSSVASITGVVTTVGLGGGSLLTGASLLYHQSLTPHSYYIITAATAICLVLMLFMPNKKSTATSRMVRLPYISNKTIGFCMAILLAWSLNGVMIAVVPGELERIGFTGWSAMVVFLSITTGAIFQPLSRRLGSHKALTLGYILLAFGVILLLIGVGLHSLTLILISAALSGASGFGLIYQGGLAAVIATSGEESARAVSGYFLFAYIGLGLPSIAIGYLAEVFGVLIALIGVTGALIGVAAVAVVFGIGHSKPQHNSH